MHQAIYEMKPPNRINVRETIDFYLKNFFDTKVVGEITIAYDGKELSFSQTRYINKKKAYSKGNLYSKRW